MSAESQKKCTRCNAVKPLSDFYRRSGARDGRQRCCKACQCELRRSNYEANIEREAERTSAWGRENRGRRVEHVAASHARHPERREARIEVFKALGRGDLVKPGSCEHCGKEASGRDLHGHHPDYSKPLNVEWLCRSCHVAEHRRD